MQRHADSHRRGSWDEVRWVRSITAGLVADRPTSGEAGDIYLATDTNVLYIHNGSAWRSISTA